MSQGRSPKRATRVITFLRREEEREERVEGAGAPLLLHFAEFPVVQVEGGREEKRPWGGRLRTRGEIKKMEEEEVESGGRMLAARDEGKRRECERCWRAEKKNRRRRGRREKGAGTVH